MKQSFAALGFVFALAVNEASAAGFERVTITDMADQPLAAAIWYPSNTLVRHLPDNPFGQALAVDGSISGKQLPLVLISHGNGGSFASHADTALALAEAGFVVAAITHTGDNSEDENYPPSRWMVDRPRHMRLLLDFMLAEWRGHTKINPARIGMFGFSAGGYTTLVAIGGIPDSRRAVEHCAVDPDELLCRLGAVRDFNDPKVATQLASGWKPDQRIRAAVIVAPGFGFAFDPHSLARITIPIQLWAAAEDRNVPYDSNTGFIREALGSPPDFHNVPRAGHYSFLPACPAKLAALPQIWQRICTDAPGFDRAAFHEEFNRRVVGFFTGRLDAKIP